VRFELVAERAAALPREFPAAPAILTPIRLDSPEALFPSEEPRRGRPAAVLVLLFPDAEGQARVLLTARVPHLSTHAGEVSFPADRPTRTTRTRWPRPCARQPKRSAWIRRHAGYV